MSSSSSQTRPGRIVVPGAFDGVGITPHGATSGGLPYPENTDPVMAGADAIKSLAQAVDPRIYRAGFSKYQALLAAKQAVTPAGPGLVSWPADPFYMPTAQGVNLANGRIGLCPQIVKAGVRIDGVCYIMTTGGSGSWGTNANSLGLYSYSGTAFLKLAETASANTNWNTAGLKFVPFLTPYTPSADTVLWAAAIATWSSMTTTPQILGVASGAPSLDLGLGLWGPFSAADSQTTLPSSIANALVSKPGNAYWTALYHQY